MRSRTLRTLRIIIPILNSGTTTAACSSRRTPSAVSPRTTSSVQRRSIGSPCPCRLRQLTAKSEGARHKEAFDLSAIVNPGEPALRKLCDRARAMRQQPVEGIHGNAHECGLAPPPALVATQYAQRSRILARLACALHELRKRCGIEDAKIHALPGERMDDMRGITDERTALAHVAFGRKCLQGKR